MKYFFKIFFLLCFTLSCSRLYSQGCSDAGVCSVGSLSIVKFDYELLPLDEKKLTQLSNLDPGFKLQGSGNVEIGKDSVINVSTTTDTVSTKPPVAVKYKLLYPKYFFQYATSYGIGDQGTTIITSQLEGNIMIVKGKLFGQLKVPYVFVNGKLGNVNGLSDLTASLTFIPFVKKRSDLSITAGVKIPTNNANIILDSLPLPMVYQTSLGSTDVLVGAKYTYKKWDFTLGYQHSFNENKNEYLHRSLSSDSALYNKHFESNHLKRADDGVFRLNRNYNYKKISASTGVLFIYHLADDDYVSSTGQKVKSSGSQGLTLNLNFSGAYSFSKKWSVVVVYASPIVTRKARPDGLTRQLVAIVGLKYSIF